MQLLIKKAIILSPGSKFHAKKKDILIKNGVIESIGDQLAAKSARIIEAKNCYISIGWFDLFADFCDPGNEQKETLLSGSHAAAAGGYTDVCLIPNNQPVTSGKSAVEYIKSKSDLVTLHPIGSVSKNTEGKDLAEMYDMKLSGALCFSDGKKPLQHTGLMLKALQYIKTFQGTILQIPEDTSVAPHGLMNEGLISTQLGIQGKPAISEWIMVQRDLELLKYTNSSLHLTGISSKRSLDLIRQAKKQGLNISCSVTPYHLLFSDSSLNTYDSLYKVNPPLRTEADRKALIKGVEDGTIDCIASHHIPQDWDAKVREFEYASSGMIGLQTVLPMLLQCEAKVNIERWIEMLTTNPRNILKVAYKGIEEKQPACLTVFSTSEKWRFNEQSNLSKSKNSPLFGHELTGKVLAIVNNHRTAIYE
ncbi:MAG: dihydroorotase [Chitinophagaceae bacterium]|nr:dihydroorotase [Chitinophagaceae bacterium]